MSLHTGGNGPYQYANQRYADNMDRIFPNGPKRAPIEPAKQTDPNSKIGRIEQYYRKNRIKHPPYRLNQQGQKKDL